MGKRFVSKRAYQRVKDAAQQRSRDLSSAGREIGEMPPPGDPWRRDAAAASLRQFCETYLPKVFSRPWSQNHLMAIRKLESAIRNGDLYAFAMPRGYGKTKLCEAACLWAILFGLRRFVVLIGATATAGRELLENIKTHLETNKRIGQDFPAVCVPLRRLEGIGQRRLLYRGEWVRMELTRRRIIFPAIPVNPAASSIIWATGITGRIRGISLGEQSEDGANLRPDLVLLDDPQTRKSAKSKGQIKARMDTLAGDVLGLTGHDNKIAGFMPCTVIEPGDMADQILDRKAYPDWRGERTKLVYEWGEKNDDGSHKNEGLWQEYRDLRSLLLQSDDEEVTAEASGQLAQFVRDNHQAMHAGSVVAWPECYFPDKGEVSALQHAWNLRLKHGESGYFAEFQNEPIDENAADRADELTDVQIRDRVNHLEQGKIPVKCEYVTAFIDVHKRLLYWIVCAWRSDFTGAVIDYGTWPRQRTRYFTLAKAAPTIQTLYSSRGGLEAQIRAALDDCSDELLDRQWQRDDGATLSVDLCLTDANWGEQSDTVYTWAGESRHRAILMPSHGKGISAHGNPMTKFTAKPNEKIGLNWITSRGAGKAVRHCLIDTNWWKSFVHARLAASPGQAGNLQFYGSKPEAHRLISEHLTVEKRIRPPGGIGRDIWELPDSKPDNHWFDAIVGCAVGASIKGAVLADHRKTTKTERPPTLAELAARAKRG